MGPTGYPRASGGAGRLRLTRRGRLVVTVLLLLLVAGLAAVLSPASRAADPARPAETAVVLPGDTLWSVAERHRPGGRPFAVIDEIRRLNGLEDHTVHPGQRLILPARR
ncbi:LysM peptidoglycan-binding domain-containing protein [Plantactinospora sp. WMMB782]|uniref:LysM peptidoglycan-binding domain-containing protein n=1 Tax=Plantactinospora sp. WMMB782 TaxID=3404121 RepID=UPI003B960BD0